jgi:hypothetical protein
MFKLTTHSQAVIDRVYRSKLLTRLISFDAAYLDDVVDERLRERILAHTSTESRHGKMTWAGRFADVNQLVLRYLDERPHHVIHDVAVSSGITSCELHDAITAAWHTPVEFYVSDKYNLYYCDGTLVRRMFTADRTLLRGSICGLIADDRERFPFVGSRILFEALRLHLRWRPPEPTQLREINLFDPRARRYIREGKLRPIHYDALVGGEEGRFTFVRCMNLLNRGTWCTDLQIETAVRHLAASLAESGILQLGRTEDVTRRNDVTFFRRVGDRLVVVAHHNRGSENIDILREAGLV